MITIRSAYSVPTPSSRRIEPAADARGSNDRQPSQDRALVTVPTPKASQSSSREDRSFERARPATAELTVQILAGPQRRGLRAERSEVERYRRTYEQATQSKAPPPKWERRA